MPTSLGKQGAWSLGAVLGQAMLRFTTQLVIGRIAGAQVLGVAALANATVQLLHLLGPSTLSSAASKFIAAAHLDGDNAAQAVQRHVRRRFLQSSTVLAGLSCLAWLWLRGVTWEVVYLPALFIAWSLYSLGRGTEYGARRVAPAAKRDICLTASGMTVVAVLAIATDADGLYMLLPMAAAQLWYGLRAWRRNVGMGVQPNIELRREIDRYVAVGTVGTLSSYGMMQGSVLAAERYGGAEGAGYYAAALALATPAALFVNAISQVLLPSSAALTSMGDQEAMRAEIGKVTRAILALMTPGIAFAVVAAPMLAMAIWGRGFAPAGPILGLLLVAVLVTSVAVPSVSALAAGSLRDYVAATSASVVAALFGLLVWVTFGGSNDVRYVAVGYLVTTIVTATSCIVIAARRLRADWIGMFIRLGIIVMGLLTLIAWKQSRSLAPDEGSAAMWLSAVGISALCSLTLFPETRIALTLLRNGTKRPRKT